jgi:hypothetical protein
MVYPPDLWRVYLPPVDMPAVTLAGASCLISLCLPREIPANAGLFHWGVSQ